MSNKVEQAVRIIADEILTPGFYMGLKDKTIDKRSTFWRANMFSQADILHDKEFMFWHEMQTRFPYMMPADICPCDDVPMIATNQSYTSRAISMASWGQGFPVDCDFTQFLMPGENPYTSSSFEEAVTRHFVDLRDKLFMGFDQKEEYWSMMLSLGGSIIVEPIGGKKQEVSFKRPDDLELEVDSGCEWCTEKGEKNNADPYADILRMHNALFDKNRGGLTKIVMNRQTCEWMQTANAALVKDCPELALSRFLRPTTTNFATSELPPKFDGARLEYIMPIGQDNVQVYCVDTSFQFCDPDTGEEICINPLEDGKVYGYNTDPQSNHAFNGVWAYGKIRNFHKPDGLMRRFFHQWINDSGTSMKYQGQSSPMAFVGCPDGSVCMTVC